MGRPGRRVDQTGRSKKDARHVRFYEFELQTAAYRSLSVGARALLIEIKALYNGSNNGELFLSVREAARRLGGADQPGKTTVSDWFWELRDRGFIKPKIEVGFNQKSAARERMATCWVLTEYATADAAPTRDFQHWTGPPTARPKIIRRSAHRYRLYPTPDSLYLWADSTEQSVPEAGQIEPNRPPKAPDLSAHRYTDSYQGEVVEKPLEAEEASAAGAPTSGRTLIAASQPAQHRARVAAPAKRSAARSATTRTSTTLPRGP